MLGVNTLETDEITFSDGTTITTNNFATASDLITYTAGSNIAISAGNEISSTDTDTTYTAGEGINITGAQQIQFDGSNLSQNIDVGYAYEIKGGDMFYYDNNGTGGTQVANNIKTRIEEKQDALTAGTNISITAGTRNLLISSTDTTYTAGTNITISAGNEISSTDTDTTYTAGDGIDITGTTIKAEYIKPQLRIISFDKDDVINPDTLETRWGNGSLHVVQTSNRQIGDSFCSGTQYEQTLTQNGYYRIRAHSNAQSDGYNDRVSFMIYLRINSTDYDQTQNKNFFSWTYIRNNSDAAHGNNSFEDYIYLTSGTTIQVRHKLETGTNRNFDNTLTNTQMDVYLNLTIERVYETNPEE